MRKSRKLVVVSAIVVGLLASVTAYAACNTTLAQQCQKTYTNCVVSTGGDPDGLCEVQYNQCLLSAGCPIP